ncbi:C3HC zinc finger-like-domain-containing protein [Ampelomyces quisqualis]|uniref:C3HC zinc finger-like-domain-containing protein n=1 Tax=Ampelomyces quisqualis TaxID=50730 RepID=A0A6A5Q7A9_AMPQU|nr:C3HC zinc finger-like-domain-containing protein [Ampelomyces quisqualis]
MTETQPALATTKRKFHKLIDSIAASTSTTSLASTLGESNTSSTSLAHKTSPEPPNKRPRSSNASIERDRSISASQARIQALKDQLMTPKRAGTVRVVGKAVVSSPSTPRKQPNFQPYSQEQFLSRVKTFADVKKWTTKPDAINEVEWARRGWTCDTWNTVACRGGCEKRVAVKLYPKRKDAAGNAIPMSEDLAVEADDKLVEKYAEMIENGHAEDCLWRKRGCQKDIYHIPIASRTTSAASLLTRYQSFHPISADLPLLENITYPDPSIQDILPRASSLFNSTVPPPSSPTDVVAFTLAVFGWSGVSESRISLATCDHCFQRLGLWLSSDTRLKEMSQKLDVPIDSLRLNLLESHREHCPWKNATSQANSPDGPIANMPAWQTLQYILLGKQKCSPEEARGQARNVESMDLGSEAEYPRGSLDSAREVGAEEDTQSLQNKWQKFKAKLRRTTSKKSLKSIKSVRSGKSGHGKAGDG